VDDSDVQSDGTTDADGNVSMRFDFKKKRFTEVWRYYYGDGMCDV